MNRHPLLLVCSLAVLATVLVGRAAAGDLKSDMQQAYKASVELFEYVWEPEAFLAKKNEQEISRRLSQLSHNFHQVRQDAPLSMFEPGFRVALEVQEALLQDIKTRFDNGAKEYALWRLRGMVRNCVGCHTRYDVSVDFSGSAPKHESPSFEGKFAEAEFLMATRQFDRASERFYSLATQAGTKDISGADAFRALKMWLVIEVRVKDRLKQAAAQLSKLADNRAFSENRREAISQWIKDLRSLSKDEKKAADPVAYAAELLEPTKDAVQIDVHEQHLVKSLKATALLHLALQQKLPTAKHREASLLLALAYHRIPIQSFEVFRELYLEQTIREFPQTPEAQQAFVLYQEYIEFVNSGSSGLHLEPEDQQKLQELRRLAFGKPALVVPDTFRMIQ
ncbi:MAG: hypothetical protein KDD44_02625 [Bdellovibrionales bacterium]|nr:hypothetical protein [Bdellovibrionales bacterium]